MESTLIVLKEIYKRFVECSRSKKALICVGIYYSPLILLGTTFYLRSKILNKKRIHWFEFHDYSWCPAPIREWITSSIRNQYSVSISNDGTNTVDKLMPYLQNVLTNFDGQIILDLCSGSGGPCPLLQKQFNVMNKDNDNDKKITVILTDLYPEIEEWQRLIDQQECINLCFMNEPINAFDIKEDKLPETCHGQNKLRTMFTSMHHFQPNQVELILNDVIDENDAFFAFEPFANTFFEYLLMVFFGSFAGTYYVFVNWRPFPFRVLPWLLIGNLMGSHDGIVSIARIYKPQNWLNIANKCSTKKGKKYVWNAQVVQLTDLPILFMTLYYGYPAK